LFSGARSLFKYYVEACLEIRYKNISFKPFYQILYIELLPILLLCFNLCRNLYIAAVFFSDKAARVGAAMLYKAITCRGDNEGKERSVGFIYKLSAHGSYFGSLYLSCYFLMKI